VIYCTVFTDDDNCRKNRIIYSLFQENNIPCPKVVFCDESSKFLKYPVIIVTEVEGKPLSELQQLGKNNDLTSIYEKFGDITARINSIKFKRFGEIEEHKGNYYSSKIRIFNEGPFKTWNEVIRKIHFKRLEGLIGSNLDYLIAPIQEFSKQYFKRLDKITPRLTHGDLNSKNIIVKNGEITGIIDVDEAMAGVIDEELMRIELDHFTDNDELREVFFNSYQKKIHLNSEYKERRRFFYISRNLIWVNLLIQMGSKISSNPHKDLTRLGNQLLAIIENRIQV
jgi:aminoglycoside phosphotransferase (APT) family kinase protein